METPDCSYLLDLQRTLGLTFDEAACLNLTIARREAKSKSVVSVFSNRTGMHRLVPCLPGARAAIQKGLSVKTRASVVDGGLSYAKMRSEHSKIAARHGFTLDSARGVFVRERYKDIVGVPPPAKAEWDNSEHIQIIASRLSVSEQDAKHIDKDARIRILKEIGGLGLRRVNNYLEKPERVERPV